MTSEASKRAVIVLIRIPQHSLNEATNQPSIQCKIRSSSIWTLLGFQSSLPKVTKQTFYEMLFSLRFLMFVWELGVLMRVPPSKHPFDILSHFENARRQDLHSLRDAYLIKCSIDSWVGTKVSRKLLCH